MACSTCNSGDSCGCNSNYKEKDFGSRQVWTQGVNPGPGAIVFVFADASIEDVATVLVQHQLMVTVSEASTGFKCKIGFQVSADGITWDEPIYFGAPDYITGNGPLLSPWLTGGNYKKKIRFVVSAEQTGNLFAIATVKFVAGMIIR